MKFGEAFPDGADVSSVANGHDDAVGCLIVELLADFIAQRLLSFNPERVNAS